MIRNEKKFSLERYEEIKGKFLSDPSICKENQKLFKQFFDEKEYELKRLNGLAVLDSSSVITLHTYLTRFRNVNVWFENKPLKNITEKDIKWVYDGLEDGVILTKDGKRFKDREGYYNKVFKSKLFELVGKAELSRKIITVTQKNDDQVRYFTEEDFRLLVGFMSKPEHKLLFWLAFDYGENASSLLKLKKKDFYRQINNYTKEPEYLLNLKPEILKRSRKSRSELNNYKETAQLLDLILPSLNDDDLLFKFNVANAAKILKQAVDKSKVRVIPVNEKPTLKDFRSSMTCDLLRKGWSRDDLNSRLGHKPSSSEIDKYLNFLAIDKQKPKQKFYHSNLDKVQDELEKTKDREKYLASQLESMKEKLESFGDMESKLKHIEDLLMKTVDGTYLNFPEDKAMVELGMLKSKPKKLIKLKR